MLRIGLPFSEILISLRYLRASDSLGFRLFTLYFTTEHSIQGRILDSLFNFALLLLVCDALRLVQRIEMCVLHIAC